MNQTGLLARAAVAGVLGGVAATVVLAVLGVTLMARLAPKLMPRMMAGLMGRMMSGNECSEQMQACMKHFGCEQPAEAQSSQA